MSTEKRVEESRERLLSGVKKFRREVYPAQRAIYEDAVRQGQQPHALFITCADSRIDPELLTQSGPGEIFVARNVGNLVPAYGVMMGGVTAVIEYAVVALGVSQIVVCGHTDCGAMKGLLNPQSVAGLPRVTEWLQHAAPALSSMKAEELVERNVLLQVHHLMTHPEVAERVANRTLAISGWVYDIAAGNVRVYDEALDQFVNSIAE